MQTKDAGLRNARTCWETDYLPLLEYLRKLVQGPPPDLQTLRAAFMSTFQVPKVPGYNRIISRRVEDQLTGSESGLASPTGFGTGSLASVASTT